MSEPTLSQRLREAAAIITGRVFYDTAIEAAAALDAQAAEIAAMRQRKDAAYAERTQVVASLARLFPSGTKRTDIPGWDAEWHGCVYIDLPTGQVSWHYHDSLANLFSALPPYSGTWDGHDTPEKYRRLAALTGSEQSAEIERLRDALTETMNAASPFMTDDVQLFVMERAKAALAGAPRGRAASWMRAFGEPR